VARDRARPGPAGNGEQPRRRPILSGKHQATLKAVFADPVRANIAWNDVSSLLRALGAIMVEGGGSMVAFTLHDARAVFHKPHPGKELPKGAVRAVRDFLTSVGVVP
jgi:hypothetical protein